MAEKTIHVPSISCGHCVMTIKNEVGELDGINTVEADEKTKMVTIKWNNPATWEKITDTLKDIGHPAV